MNKSKIMVTHLFFLLRLRVQAGGVAVHLLREPLADVRHILRVQLLQIYAEDVSGYAQM